MYNENNNGINLKDIIIKAIFLVLFVLLIVWLFPKVPNMKAFYSNVFRENIKYMQEAAESYYTTDKLPKNVGESVELTLQEMIDKNIIIPFVDKDGKECDGKKSFAQITKNKTDYTLTVTLVCPKEKNTLKKTLGCHNYCADCESLENQFQRQVTSNQNSVNCNRGGSFNGSKCVIATPVPVVYDATKITTPGTSVCSEGTPDGKGGCLVTTMVNENGKVEYTNGGTTTVPAERVETTTYVAANSSQTKSYVPASKSTQTTYVPAREVGGTETVVKALVRQGNDVTYPAKENKTAHTLNGYYTEKPQGYSCSYGIAPSTCTDCVSYKSYYYNCTATKTTYSCPDGGDLDSTGKTCVIKGTKTYYCEDPNATLNSNNTCTIKSEVTYVCDNGATPTKKHNCPVETEVWTCSDGSTPNSDHKCTIYTTNYSCSNNATPTSDHKCPVVSYDYVCSAGTKSGSNCIITGDKVPYCTKGQLNANKTACVYQVPKTITVPATTTPGSSSLDCQGGELNADNKTCTKYNYNYEYYEGVVISKAVTTYEYKWSTQDSIEGWTKTGQTRRIEA